MTRFSSILLILVLLWPPAAAAKDTPEIDLLDRHAVEIAMMDYPELHLPWLRQKLQQLNPEVEPIAWARACWGLSIRDTADDAVILNEYLNKCLHLAHEHRLYLEWTDLRYSQLRRQIDSNSETTRFFHELDRLITKVRSFQDDDAIAYILVLQSFELMGLRKLDKSMPNVIEANELVDSGRATSDMVRYVTKSALDMSLDYQGLPEKALEVNKQMGEYFRKQGARFTTARTLYNLGYTLLQKDSPDYPGAEAALLDAYRLAGVIEEHDIQGYALVSMSLLDSRHGLHKEAIQKAQEAIGIFASSSRVWLSRSQTRLAEVLINAHEYKAALPHLKAAWESTSPESRDYRNGIHWQQYRAWAGLKDSTKALYYLEQYTTGFRELAKIQQKEAYNRASVTLGLQHEQERSATFQANLRTEEEKNRLLKEQNEYQARELIMVQRLRIAAVTLCILLGITGTAMMLAVRRGRQVARAKDKIQSIIDSIDEGILTIDRHMQVRDEHSVYMQRLFPQENLTGRNIVEAILQKSRASQEELSIWKESLAACLGEDSIAWEFNGHNLPHELTIEEPEQKVLSLHWQPILISGRMQRLLLSIRDVSSVKALEHEIRLQRQNQEGMLHHMMEILSHNFQESKRLVLDMELMLVSGSPEDWNREERIAWRRRLHTYKGVARSLGLDALSRSVHALEDALKDGAERADLVKVMTALVNEIKIYKQVFDEVLKTPEGQVASGPTSLLTTVDTLLPDIQARLHKASIPMRGLDVHDEVLHWNNQILPDIRDILVHSLSNAVDHGFILPASRGQATAPAHFTIHATRKEERIDLVIRDNGAGLDATRLEALAVERGFVPGPDQSLYDMLFLDGVSLANSVTQTSGRGVGLAAVQAVCREYQGRVTIAPNPDGQGMMLVIQLGSKSESRS